MNSYKTSEKIRELTQRIPKLKVNSSIRTKLVLMVLGVSIGSMGAIGYISYENGKANLRERIFYQLNTLRSVRSNQITTYFDNLTTQIQRLNQDWRVINAMKDFKAAYRDLEQETRLTNSESNPNISTNLQEKQTTESNSDTQPKSSSNLAQQTPGSSNADLNLTSPNNLPKKIAIPSDLDAKLNTYYEQEYLPKLTKITEGKPILELYKPRNPAARYLQYHYIAANSNPVGKKDLLDNAKDGSEYSRIHDIYHPVFRRILKRFSYYDIFLIDPETGDIIYTASKETDFATNLLKGPYNQTNLAEAAKTIMQVKAKGYTKIVDFKSYYPSFGAPAAFIATPIFDKSELIGILAVQIPVDPINQIMTNNQNWEKDGLGKSGKTELVGSDYKMRSISRFLIEDKENYLKNLRAANVSNSIINKIKEYGTTILLTEVKTTATKEAFAGKEGTQIIKDNREVTVLSSYSPLPIRDLNWAIITEIDIKEAYAPIYGFQGVILLWSSLLVIIVTGGAILLSYIFIKPVNILISNASKISNGDTDNLAKLNVKNEFGELDNSFNNMVDVLQSQRKLIDEKSQDNEEIILKIFPESLIKRLKNKEKNIGDLISNVTVLFSDIEGFSQLYQTMSIDEVVAILNDIVNAFDRSAEQYGIDKIKTLGDNYVAACGLSNPKLDHSKRIVDFALEMRSIIRRFNLEKGLNLDICIGIHSGEVMQGIIGREKVTYDVWGEPVSIANRSLGSPASLPGSILVSQNVYEAVADIYEFELVSYLETRNNEKLGLWLLQTTVTSQILTVKV